LTSHRLAKPRDPRNRLLPTTTIIRRAQARLEADTPAQPCRRIYQYRQAPCTNMALPKGHILLDTQKAITEALVCLERHRLSRVIQISLVSLQTDQNIVPTQPQTLDTEATSTCKLPDPGFLVFLRQICIVYITSLKIQLELAYSSARVLAFPQTMSNMAVKWTGLLIVTPAVACPLLLLEPPLRRVWRVETSTTRMERHLPRVPLTVNSKALTCSVKRHHNHNGILNR
jgi:hypothetical protein